MTGKQTMDLLRRQVAGLAAKPAAIVTARRADITRMESAIGALTIAGVILGILGGTFGIILFTSGISRRVVAIAANADLLGQGQPLRPRPSARDKNWARLDEGAHPRRRTPGQPGRRARRGPGRCAQRHPVQERVPEQHQP